jgi:multisubunit Na+/H+ antiporter MnhF subunit
VDKVDHFELSGTKSFITNGKDADVAIVYALLSYISTLFIAKYLEGGEF